MRSSAGTPLGILSTVGRTPLVRLHRLYPDHPVYAKVERFNPGGSVKDRSAVGMLVELIESGRIVPGRSVVVESSSGNLAVGIAQVCAYFGVRFVCVVDAKTTQQNRAVLRALGAEIEVVTARDPATGEYLPMRLARVRELVEADPDAVNPDQYRNPRNPASMAQVLAEITDELGQVDHVFCATSTCGTLRGCAEYARTHRLRTRFVAVDARGSAIFGDAPARRLIPGHGASIVPPLHGAGLADEVVHVSDLDCVVGCRRLVGREAILAGGSSGAVVTALDRTIDRLPADAVRVAIFPDGGDRYLDTIYSDRWVTRHFGEVAHLWKDGGTSCRTPTTRGATSEH